MTPRVFVADDQLVICAGFAALLDAQRVIRVVGTAAYGRELVDLVSQCDPDVALVDVRMPVIDGIEATALITGSYSTKVLALTTFDLDEYVFVAIEAGASGFLLNVVTGDRLVEGPACGGRLDAAGAGREPTTGCRLRPAWRVDGRRTRSCPGSARVNVRSLSCWPGLVQLGDIGIPPHRRRDREVARRRNPAKLQLRDRIQAVVFAFEIESVIPGE